MRAREAELKRMDKDKELPVVVRLFCGGLAGGISQTGKSGFPQTGKSGMLLTVTPGFLRTDNSLSLFLQTG